MKFFNHTKSGRRDFLKAASLGILSLSLFPKLDFLNKKNTAGSSPVLPGKGNTNMAYEWKFNPRPYSDEEAKSLLKDVIDAETTDWHYNTHHKGYVTFLNTIEKGLETADASKANGNWSDIGELKRRFTWNHSGALLHDVYAKTADALRGENCVWKRSRPTSAKTHNS